MLRLINLVLAILVLYGAVQVYQVKEEAEQVADQLHKVRKNIVRSKLDISVLRAEWAHINRPGRIQKLSEQNSDILELVPIQSWQIGTIDELPYPAIDASPSVSAAGGLAALPSSQTPNRAR